MRMDRRAGLLFRSAGVSRYGTAIALTEGKTYLAAGSNRMYAIFAGGYYGSYTAVNSVDGYTASLSKSTPADGLSKARYGLACATAGDYVIFAGGNSSKTVDAYNANLAHSTPNTLSTNKSDLGGASVADYAVFAGGYDTKTVEAYNSSLVKYSSSISNLSQGRSHIAGVGISTYAIFAGGYYSSTYTYYNNVEAYNSSLAKSTPSVLLSTARGFAAGAKAGDIAIFAGGRNSSYLNTVDAYNSSLVHFTPTEELTYNVTEPSGASAGKYAVFAGGLSSGGSTSPAAVTVQAYNASLVKFVPDVLQTSRYHAAGASIGKYALFAGGQWSSGGMQFRNSVEVYQS